MKLKDIFKRNKEHNPDDFRLRIVPAWFCNNKEYVQFEYSLNRGKKWKVIHCCTSPIISALDNYTWEILSYKLGDGEFSYERNKFGSYEKIKKFEEEQYQKLIEGNKRHAEERNKINKKRINALKRANGE